MGSILMSCMNENNRDDSKTKQPYANISETKEIVLKLQPSSLLDGHPNEKQIICFINNYKEAFVDESIKINALTSQNLIQKAYRFRTISTSTYLILFFCETEKDAIAVWENNDFSEYYGNNFGVLGSVLYIVDGEDEHNIGNLLSWFSKEGKEQCKMP